MDTNILEQQLQSETTGKVGSSKSSTGSGEGKRSNRKKKAKAKTQIPSGASYSMAHQLLIVLGTYGPMTIPQLASWLAAADPQPRLTKWLNSRVQLSLQLAVKAGMVAEVSEVLARSGGTGTGVRAGYVAGITGTVTKRRGPGRPARPGGPAGAGGGGASVLAGANQAASLSALNPTFSKVSWFGDTGRPLKLWAVTEPGQFAYRQEMDSLDTRTGAITVPGAAIPASHAHTFGVQETLSVLHTVCATGQALSRSTLPVSSAIEALPAYTRQLVGPGLPVVSLQLAPWAFTIQTGFGEGLQPTLQPDACGRFLIRSNRASAGVHQTIVAGQQPGQAGQTRNGANLGGPVAGVSQSEAGQSPATTGTRRAVSGRWPGGTLAAPGVAPDELADQLGYQGNIIQTAAPVTGTTPTPAPARFDGSSLEHYRAFTSFDEDDTSLAGVETEGTTEALSIALEYDRATETPDVFGAKYYAYAALYNALLEGLPYASALPALWTDSSSYPLVLVITEGNNDHLLNLILAIRRRIIALHYKSNSANPGAGLGAVPTGFSPNLRQVAFNKPFLGWWFTRLAWFKAAYRPYFDAELLQRWEQTLYKSGAGADSSRTTNPNFNQGEDVRREVVELPALAPSPRIWLPLSVLEARYTNSETGQPVTALDPYQLSQVSDYFRADVAGSEAAPPLLYRWMKGLPLAHPLNQIRADQE